MRHLTNKDFVSGLVFVVAGLVGLSLSIGFDFGTTARPGPGFFPIVLSVLLTLIGFGISLGSLFSAPDLIEMISPRPILFVTVAVCLFAFSVDPFGLVPAVFVATICASFGKENFGHMHRVLLAICLSVFSALLFIGALGLPIAMWSF